MTSVWARIRARRPLWAVYPTARLASLALVAGVLWLLPGIAGRIAGLSAAAVLVLMTLADYVRLPHARNVEVERTAPETIGLGDPARAGVRRSLRMADGP